MGSTTKATNAGSVFEYTSLCRKAGNHEDVRVIGGVAIK
jgi:hypothetical protein